MVGRSLSLKDWKLVVKNNKFADSTLLLTGGEPSLHKDLNKFIEFSKPHFAKISLNTNGVESSWLNELTSNAVHVQISLDGTPKVHNLLRSKDDYDVYEKINTTIKKLEMLNIKYNIATTVSKENFDDIMNLMSWVERYEHMSYWKISPVLPFGCGSLGNTVSITEWNQLVDNLIEHSRVRIKIRRLFDFGLLDKFVDDGKSVVRGSRLNCGNIKNKIYIYPDLTVYPCTCLTDFPLGNLHTSSLKEILNSDTANRFKNYTVLPESKCYDCKYLKFCNGGCIGMSYNHFGKLGMGDYRCPLQSK
jgi:radical SAM protein with 4Fe4S-binding SPASM domain